MGKNYFLIGVFALVVMMFAACSNEDKPGEATATVIPKLSRGSLPGRSLHLN